MAKYIYIFEDGKNYDRHDLALDHAREIGAEKMLCSIVIGKDVYPLWDEEVF